MKCPYCNHPKTTIYKTQDHEDEVQRYRKCPSCNMTLSTIEQSVDDRDALPPSIPSKETSQATPSNVVEETKEHIECPNCGCSRFEVTDIFKYRGKEYRCCVCYHCGSRFRSYKKMTTVQKSSETLKKIEVREDNPYL